jgi:lysophospholipase L1-like esterase
VGETSAREKAPGSGSRRAGLALAVALGLAAAWAFQTLALRLGNTLHAGGRFESTKVGLDHGILGAVSFVATRTALWRDRLDLGVWHGYHELLLREPVTPERIALRFRLRDGGWLALLVARSETRFEAVRVSRDGAFPAACLAGTAAGAFDAKAPLAQPALDAGWHALAVERDGAQLRVALDGTEVGRCARALEGPVRVGLRGSAADHVEVDDLRVESATPPALVEEDFANRRGAGRLALGALAAVAGVNGLVAAASARARRARGTPLALPLVTANLVLAAAAGLALLADTLYFGRIHPERIDFRGFENRIEYVGRIAPRLTERYPLAPPPPGVRRIVVLGTSQTWGSGAARPEDVWVTRLEALLQAQARPGERFELVNAGLPGETSAELEALWRERWVAWQPELVLVNLGNNDRDPAALARNVERIAVLNGSRGIRTVLVPEANSTESRSERSLRGLEAKHAALREVAARHGLAVVEAHAPLVAARDDGFLWWDRVHLTAYGQERLARLLFEARAHWLDEPARAHAER